jgi:N-acetylglucosaminyldiphosphoundecaprenol N-acetyl-beta-D-mannosaminyltransferase
MIIELAKLSSLRGYRLFLLGAAPGVARRAADHLCSLFPQLQIAGCLSPSFGSWSAEEQAEVFARIQQTRTDILLVAFGQPKGERWIHQHHQQLGIPLSIQLGASFDFLAGTAKRAPTTWQRLGCEWLYRSLSEPRRLGPRYLSNIRFLCRCLLSDALSSVRQRTRAQ